MLDLSDTYVRRLPREIYYVKGLFELNLKNCPLDDDIAEVYPQGIVPVMAFYKNLMQRAIYRVRPFPIVSISLSDRKLTFARKK